MSHDCGCDSQAPRDGLLPVEEARATLLAAAPRLTDHHPVPLAEAAGRVLAEAVVSPIDVPGHDNSAMDGYAVRAADTQAAPCVLPVSQRIPAGHNGEPLQPGTAARIFTGAPLPPGADAVIMQEQTEPAAEGVRLLRPVRPGENVRPRANDVARGSEVLAAGTRLTPQAVGLLASLGIDRVDVRVRPRVALLCTGDELAEPGEPLLPGQIYNSNRPMLSALLGRAGCEVLDLGRVEDTLAATRQALHAGAEAADLILTTGGVSVGEEDHVKAAVEAEGELHLWRLRMKPGKPLAFGTVAGTPLLGLPGNPVSAFVTALLFALPFLRQMQGRAPAFPVPLWARFDGDWPRPRPRREFLRVRLRAPEQPGAPWAEPFARQGSDVLTGAVWADGLLEVPEERTWQRGDLLRYWPFTTLLD